MSMLQICTYNLSCRPFAHSAASGSENRHFFSGHVNSKCMEVSREPRTKEPNSLPVWSAVCTNRGPRKLPPIPTDTTFVNAFPVAPTCSTRSSNNQY